MQLQKINYKLAIMSLQLAEYYYKMSLCNSCSKLSITALYLKLTKPWSQMSLCNYC